MIKTQITIRCGQFDGLNSLTIDKCHSTIILCVLVALLMI